MRTFKIIFVLMTITSLLFCQSLKKEVESWYEGKTVKWEKSLEDLFNFDIVVAKGSKDFVIAQIDKNNLAKVEYYNSEGDLLWKKEISKVTGIEKLLNVKIRISDSGNSVMIFWTGDHELVICQIFTKSGDLLYTSKVQPVIVESIDISLDGKYTNFFRPIGTLDGEIIKLKFPYEISKRAHIVTKIVDNGKIVVDVDDRSTLFHSSGIQFWMLYDINKNEIIKHSVMEICKNDKFYICAINNYFFVKDKLTNTTTLYDNRGNAIWGKNDFSLLEHGFDRSNYFFDKSNMKLYYLKRNILYCYKLNDGEKIWERPINEEELKISRNISVTLKENKLFISKYFYKSISKPPWNIPSNFITQIWKLDEIGNGVETIKDKVHIIPSRVTLTEQKNIKFYSGKGGYYEND